jgi:hypothetical protein
VTVVDFRDIDFDLCQRGFGYAYFEAPKIYSRAARARRRVVEGVSPKVARIGVLVIPVQEVTVSKPLI